jgi:hypothetical protein
MPQLLRDLVEQRIAEQPDMVLGGRLADLPADAPDVIVCGEGCHELLARRAGPRVLRIDEVGRASMHELREHTKPIGDVSPAQVVDAIRALAARGA